jgi:AAA domain
MTDELDRVVADLETKRREKRSDWQPVDLVPILTGEVVEPAPSILRRTDGVGLIYPAKVNSLYAEPEGIKTWLALAACYEQIVLGEPVLFLDFEDTPTGITERLRDLGATAEQIARLFVYIRPESPATPEIVNDLPGIGATLTILDGVTEAMTLQGLEIGDNSDVARFVELLPRPLARMGTAVWMLDHVVKDRNGRGRYAIGAQHKLAGLSGAAYLTEVVAPFGRGMTGLSRLTVTKDRPGYVRPESVYGKGAGDVHLRSDPEDGSVRIQIEPQADPQETGFRPTYYMERVSRHLEIAGEQTMRAVRDDVKGKSEYIAKAIHQLVAEGYLARRDGPGGSVLVSSVNP